MSLFGQERTLVRRGIRTLTPKILDQLPDLLELGNVVGYGGCLPARARSVAHSRNSV